MQTSVTYRHRYENLYNDAHISEHIKPSLEGHNETGFTYSKATDFQHSQREELTTERLREQEEKFGITKTSRVYEKRTTSSTKIMYMLTFYGYQCLNFRITSKETTFGTRAFSWGKIYY